LVQVELKQATTTKAVMMEEILQYSELLRLVVVVVPQEILKKRLWVVFRVGLVDRVVELEVELNLLVEQEPLIKDLLEVPQAPLVEEEEVMPPEVVVGHLKLLLLLLRMGLVEMVEMAFSTTLLELIQFMLAVEAEVQRGLRRDHLEDRAVADAVGLVQLALPRAQMVLVAAAVEGPTRRQTLEHEVGPG
jgi:hypothetical protein